MLFIREDFLGLPLSKKYNKEHKDIYFNIPTTNKYLKSKKIWGIFKIHLNWAVGLLLAYTQSPKITSLKSKLYTLQTLIRVSMALSV